MKKDFVFYRKYFNLFYQTKKEVKDLKKELEKTKAKLEEARKSYREALASNKEFAESIINILNSNKEKIWV